MSKRAKFTLITWIGENVSGLQRAKISTDKTLVKDVCQVRLKSFFTVLNGLFISMIITKMFQVFCENRHDLLFSMQNFAKEFMVSDIRELEEDYIRNELKKAGGANYDAQAE